MVGRECVHELGGGAIGRSEQCQTGGVFMSLGVVL